MNWKKFLDNDFVGNFTCIYFVLMTQKIRSKYTLKL